MVKRKAEVDEVCAILMVQEASLDITSIYLPRVLQGAQENL
jgi:hypothetical protein